MLAEPKCWEEIGGDKRFKNWCAKLEISGETIPSDRVKPCIEGVDSFMKNPEEIVANDGEIIIYHEESGARNHHSATVTIGYCCGEQTHYIQPEQRIKSFIYGHRLISRQQFSGAGDHIAAIRIGVAIRNMESDIEKAKAMANDSDAPDALREIASSIIAQKERQSNGIAA